MNVNIKALNPTALGAQSLEVWWLFRSLVFYALMLLFTLVFCGSATLLGPMIPQTKRFELIIGTWTRVVIYSLRAICGVRWEIRGHENIPATPCILYAKHQSTWETFFLQILFAPQSQVIKRELLAVPFFGWAFSLLAPIAIDRGNRREALTQILEQGAQRLAEGYWILIFPEGTRVRPGERRRFSRGGATLSIHTGSPLLPIAHDAGKYWPNNRLIKVPGTIRLVIGQPMPPDKLTANELTEKAEAWINTTVEQLS